MKTIKSQNKVTIKAMYEVSSKEYARLRKIMADQEPVSFIGVQGVFVINSLELIKDEVLSVVDVVAVYYSGKVDIKNIEILPL